MLPTATATFPLPPPPSIHRPRTLYLLFLLFRPLSGSPVIMNTQIAICFQLSFRGAFGRGRLQFWASGLRREQSLRIYAVIPAQHTGDEVMPLKSPLLSLLFNRHCRGMGGECSSEQIKNRANSESECIPFQNLELRLRFLSTELGKFFFFFSQASSKNK